ncbi:MAG: hypothetical protein C0391_05390 [Anaerolinea sp.]|nr:hypothetical protein [Anaerolinea sp.]
MTWVIGRPGIFGYALGISDIRVTLSDGSTHDCLQKIYQISPLMVIGFAGSVKIGFEIVNQFILGIRKSSEEQSFDPRFVDPIFIAKQSTGGLSLLFNSFEEREKNARSEILLIGVHPTINDGAAPWAKAFVVKFVSPDFKPHIYTSNSIVPIGSGANIPLFNKELDNLQKDIRLLESETMIQEGSGLLLANQISEVIKKNPQDSISDLLQICIVKRDGIRMGSITREIISKPDTSEVMPPLAKSWAECLRLINSKSATSCDYATC